MDFELGQAGLVRYRWPLTVHTQMIWLEQAMVSPWKCNEVSNRYLDLQSATTYIDIVDFDDFHAIFMTTERLDI